MDDSEASGDDMRDDWNARAREDAGYYVAFGRREQSDADFFATATEVINSLESELRRVPPPQRSAWKALEIGCGPGRLMRPMSRHFAEIHGVDVSDEMIALARERLRDTPNAHPHVSDGASLSRVSRWVVRFRLFLRGVPACAQPRRHRGVYAGNPPRAENRRLGAAPVQRNARRRCLLRYLGRARASLSSEIARIHATARHPALGPGRRRNAVHVDHLAQAAAGLASRTGPSASSPIPPRASGALPTRTARNRERRRADAMRPSPCGSKIFLPTPDCTTCGCR